jgi:WD40 repeat protein
MSRNGADDPTLPSADPASSGDWSVGGLAERWFGDREARPNELDGRYELGEVLGRGGMGVVRSAHDRRLRREVAIKAALGTDAEDVGRFLHEAQVTGQLAHPNIPPIHDLGLTGEGSVFFSMRALPGRTLSKVLSAEGPFSVPRALEVFGKLCDAVAYAHSRGVLHRDLKPGNIILGEFGEVYVIDWGLAKRIRGREQVVSEADEDGSDLTRQGVVVGTPAYMSPEQLGGSTALDERADVYALGILLYALLTGKTPFHGPADSILLKVVRGEYPAPRRVRRSIPWELEAVIQRAMASRAAARYPSVAALQVDLLAFGEGRRLPGIWYGPWRIAARSVVRHSRWVGLALALGGGTALVGLLVVGSYAWLVGQARDRAVEAEQLASRRAVDQQVAVARMRAQSGFPATARQELLTAIDRYGELGWDPTPALLARSALDQQFPPPELRFEGKVTQAALDPRGDRVAFVVDGAVVVHDLLTGSLLSRWQPPTGVPVLLRGWDDGHPRVLVRDATGWSCLDELGAPRWSLPLADGTRGELQFGVGARVAVVQTSAGQQVVSVPDGSPLGPPVEGGVQAVSAGGSRLVRSRAPGGRHRQVTHFDLLDVATGAIVASRDDIEGAIWTDDLSRFVLASGDGLRLTDWAGEVHWTRDGKEPWVTFTPDRDGVVSVTADGQVEVLDLETGHPRSSRRVGRGRAAGSGAPQVGTGWVTAATEDATHVWSLVDRPGAVPAHAEGALGVDVSPDGVLAATVGWDGDLVLWDWAARIVLWSRPMSAEGTRAVAFSPDGERVAVGDREGRVHVVDVRTGEVSVPHDDGRGFPMAVDWIDERRLLVAYEDGSLQVFDPETWARATDWRGDLRTVWAMDLRDGRAAVSGRSEEAWGELWDVAAGRRLEVAPTAGAGFGVAVAPAGDEWAVGTSFGGTWVSGGPSVPTDPGGAVMTLAYVPDAPLLLAGTLDGSFVVRHRTDGRELLRLQLHRGATQDLALVPGTDHVVSVGGQPGTMTAFELLDDDDTLVVAAGTDPGPADLLAAAARAERRGDWVHAARALDRAVAQRTAVGSIRLARAHLAAGDLAGCRDALGRPPGDEAEATRARFVERCAERGPATPDEPAR